DNDIVITSYVYNNYHLFNRSGVLKNSFGLGNNIGTFINPTDYDSKTNTLIGAAGTGNVAVYEITGTNVKTSTKSLKGFSSAKVSAIKISPFQLNTGKTDAFLGTQGSKILHLQNMSGLFGTTVVDISSSEFRGVVSSIDVGSSTDEMLATFSNYGIESVWYTNDGGDNWESKESNLPDMPIRWGIFNKGDRKNVLIATELGVWETKDITVSNPVWTPVNEGLANVRVNMLSTTSYDNTVIAATYGRGLFSTKLSGGLSIDNNDLAAEFKVYPNPVVNETLYIEPSNSRNISDVKLYNTNGQLVLSKAINSSNKTELNVSGLEKGQYILKVETDGGEFSKNILVK
ncbi:MAG: T9SS type A sorting domain-containing protein, partial [Flavobacteriales bacterium]|nr:T9SS type A sorting domain-containing protein [Flavobacteriales bacterium]